MKPVWIVDDDRSIRWVFEKALAREGIALKAFASAQEAIDELEIASPQVLVSDIRMPGPSGLDLLQLVKKRHPALPVIIMTAYSDLESAVARHAEQIAKGIDAQKKLLSRRFKTKAA